MSPETVALELAELIERRAARQNVQSKHGREAAEAYELSKLCNVLDDLMDEAKG